MGLAGSGKGTQGKLLSEKLGYEYLSTGEYLREYLSSARKEQILAGKLIDDQEMINIIDDFLAKTDKESILDGFPRSKVQADWLVNKHLNKEINIEAVIYLQVSRDELVSRLIARGRADDTKEAIQTRFDEYAKSTLPIIEDYQSRGIKIIEIEGTGSIEVIHSQIMEGLRK